jgi:uncharacterized protein (TIGR02145 family)
MKKVPQPIFEILIFSAILCLVSCQKQESLQTSEQIAVNPGLRDLPGWTCETVCINPDNPVYYELSDLQMVTWGGQNKPKTKTVEIAYYNTATQFVLKVRSTNGWNDLVIDGVSSWFNGPVPLNQWGVHTVDLPAGWQACDEYGFSLQVVSGGPPALFSVAYTLVGVCTNLAMTDVDGNIYPVVNIGSQIWMGENLKTTHFSDGTPIPLLTDGITWSNLLTPGFAWSGNDPANKDLYGALYNWYAVNTGLLCPCGWHVPTNLDWNVLTEFMGGIYVAGGKLKSLRTEPDPHPRWNIPNTGASDESGFSGLPGGIREAFAGDFVYQGTYGFWWSANENLNPATLAYARGAGFSAASFALYTEPKAEGLSVRCIKD